MILDLAAVDAALIDALPVLSVTAFPVLAITAGVAWWLRGQEPEDDFNVDDYREPAVGRAAVRRLRPVEAHTQVVDLAVWNASTPVYAALADRPMPQVVARRVANTWLEEIGQRARTGATA